jgi:hypothetical protein
MTAACLLHGAVLDIWYDLQLNMATVLALGICNVPG